MAGTADRPARFAADLPDVAAVEGARQSRSAMQPLDHWARLGRAPESRSLADLRAVLDGSTPPASLSAEAQIAVNAGIDADIEERAARASSGRDPISHGIPVVGLDCDGELVRCQPDGSTAPATAWSGVATRA